MIIKLEGVTVEQLADLYRFIRSKTNCETIKNDDDRGAFSPFAKIKECKASFTPEGAPYYAPNFHLTLEVEERTPARSCDRYRGEVKNSKTVPLRLLVELLGALGLFPDESAATDGDAAPTQS